MSITVPGRGAAKATGTSVGSLAGQLQATARKASGAAPPPQYYDPALDAEKQQAQTANDQQQADYGYAPDGTPIGRYSSRTLDSYNVNSALNTQSNENSLSDLLTSMQRGTQDLTTQRASTQQQFGYSMADLLRDRSRETEDYGNATTANVRNFQRLGVGQTQSAQAAGVAGGGALAAALGARDTNQAIAQQPLDLSHSRYQADSSTQQQRLQQSLADALAGLDTSGQRLSEDYATGTTRQNQAYSNAQGQLATGYQNDVEDQGVTNTRTQQALAQLLQQISASQWAQAAQNGYGGY